MAARGDLLGRDVEINDVFHDAVSVNAGNGSALPVWAALASVIKTVFFSMFISFSRLDLVSSANTAAGDARTLRNSQISACDCRWPIEMVIRSIVSG